MNDLSKAAQFAKNLIIESITERDNRGYRENLGYDQRPKLKNYLNKLELTYQEKNYILSTFDTACENL